MPRLDRYILSQLTVLFGFFSLVLVSVYWVNRAVGLFDELISDGQSGAVFLQFTALALPNVIRLVLPISAFAATVYVANRLTVESELVVAQATGFSPLRLARPVIQFGLGVVVLVMLLNHFLVPASRAEMSKRRAEISENLTPKLLIEGQFVHPAKGITLFIRAVSPLGELQEMFLSDARSADARVTYTAKRALLAQSDDGPKLVMFDGMAQTLDRETGRLATTRFKDSVYDISEIIKQTSDYRPNLRELTTFQLLTADPVLMENIGASHAAALYEGHSRFSQALIALAAVMIGFGAMNLGSFSRFGATPQILAAIAMLIVLQLLDNVVTDYARQDASLVPVAYLPASLGVIAGWVLLYYASNPFRLFGGARRRVAA